MPQSFESLTATGQTEPVKILGPSSVRLHGTWVGTVQPQIRTFGGDTDWTNLGAELTANDAFMVDIARLDSAELRLDCTAFTSGTIEAEVF